MVSVTGVGVAAAEPPDESSEQSIGFLGNTFSVELSAGGGLLQGGERHPLSAGGDFGLGLGGAFEHGMVMLHVGLSLYPETLVDSSVWGGNDDAGLTRLGMRVLHWVSEEWVVGGGLSVLFGFQRWQADFPLDDDLSGGIGASLSVEARFAIDQGPSHVFWLIGEVSGGLLGSDGFFQQTLSLGFQLY